MSHLFIRCSSFKQSSDCLEINSASQNLGMFDKCAVAWSWFCFRRHSINSSRVILQYRVSYVTVLKQPWGSAHQRSERTLQRWMTWQYTTCRACDNVLRSPTKLTLNLEPSHARFWCLHRMHNSKNFRAGVAYTSCSRIFGLCDTTSQTVCLHGTKTRTGSFTKKTQYFTSVILGFERSLT